MDYLDLLLRWIHILSGIVLVGGTVFWRCAVVPASARLAQSNDEPFQEAVRSNWAKLVMVTSGLLLVSGLINAVNIIRRFELETTYHMMVGIKFILALVLFWISATIAGRSAMANRFRQKLRLWLNLSIVLAIVLVCLASVMKMTPRSPKPADTAASKVHPAPDIIPWRV